MRRNVEEVVMDSFQDLLVKVEDGSCSFPYKEAISCNEFVDEDSHKTSEVSTNESNTTIHVECETAEVRIPGLMQWLTGQKHVPLGHETFIINVYFDQECMESNPGHRLCFPVVGACAKEITIPVEHTKTFVEFEEVFLLAFGTGQALARA